MPSPHTTTGKRATKRSSSASKTGSAAKKTSSSASRANDAVSLLKTDHRTVEKLFGQFERSKDESQKQQVAQQICQELRVHSQLEEELVYPTSREFLKDDEIVNEAVVEHQAVKDLIQQIEGMAASDEMFDAKVTVLKEQVEHHVQEEEKEFFPQIQKTDMDLKGIGEQLMMRKRDLMAQMGGDTFSTH